MSGHFLRSSWLPWLLVAIYATWLASGIFPISPIEGDEQGVINGAIAMAHGEIAYLDLAYLPMIQPGAYVVLAQGSRWTHVPVETLFAASTAVGSLLCVWFAARMLARVLHLPLWATLAALLWCQEMSAGAYYMNTTAMGMWLPFLALWLACRPPTWRTCLGMSVCLALAGWIRIDCLLPAPAIAVLLFAATNNWRTTLRVTALTAAASLALVCALYRGTGIEWETIVSTYAGRGAITGWWPTIRALPLLLSPLLCVLLTFGIARLLVRRQWRLLALMLAGSLPTLPIYGTSFASTKYFYHLIPFLLIAVLSAAMFFRERIGVLRGKLRLASWVTVAVLLVADQVVALRTSSPEFRRYSPTPTLVTMATFPGRERPASIVVGAGEVIPIVDGFRLRGGPLFAPVVWRGEKFAMQEELARLSEILRTTENASVYYSGWLPYQMIVRILRAEGYAFTNGKLATNTMPYTGEWKRGNRRVQIAYLAYRTSTYFDPAVHPANLTAPNTYFIGDLSGIQPITELADTGVWAPLWPEHLWRAITVYQRRSPIAPPSR